MPVLSEPQRQAMTLRTLSLPLKVLVTCFLLTMGIEPLFAYTVIGGGILMGMSLAGQITISLFEMRAATGSGREAVAST